MARLSARERAALPDRAFAYVASTGQRRLPIHDEAHVRAALGRFDRVRFETDEARDLARQRLLNAAKRHGIMPVGFITSQLRGERSRPDLPTGNVTFLLVDMEGSTALLQQLDDGYASLLRDVRAVVHGAVTGHRGHRVDAHGDEYFGVFETAQQALSASIEMQRAMDSRSWPCDLPVRVRAGVHSGRPTLTESGYVGLSVHTVARICSVAHGGQVLVSAQSRAAIGVPARGVRLVTLGAYRLPGLPREEELFQAHAPGLRDDFPPLRILR